MFHVELRQFPHNFCRFNLTERQLCTMVVDAWTRGDWVELGERRWDPRQASLTVIEGPELPIQDLSMGRGWRNAQRQGSDVTQRMLSAARGGQAAGASGSAGLQGTASSASAGLQTATSGGVELLVSQISALLGEEPLPLMRAWQLALERHPDKTPSQCLALAEDLVRR